MTVTDTRLATIEASIREIPDFPKPGILFRDITTLLAKPEALRATIDMIVEHYKDMNIGYVAGLESRGFIFGSAVAERLGAGLILVRKPGKLPAAVKRHEYTLEYGTDALEIHEDAFTYHKDQSNKRVLICDDLLATGGTASAAAQLIQKVGGDLVGAAFVIELAGLNGRAKLPAMDIYSLIKA